MTKEEKDRFDKLRRVLNDCIGYVGQANYSERERHAKRVANKAFCDYAQGKTPKWFVDDTDDYEFKPYKNNPYPLVVTT